MYHRGTLEEFTTWHEAVKILEGIPNEQTTAYSQPIVNPNDENDCVWLYGDREIPEKQILTKEDFLGLQWVESDEI